MNQELNLKLQAYLDGELSDRERRRVEESLADDGEATRLLRELAWTRSALVDHEPTPALPESREFYWGKIARVIEHEDREQTGPGSVWSAWLARIPWRQALAPAAGMVAVLMLVLVSMKFYDLGVFENYPRHLAQIENPSEEVGAFSFRSQSENVFVIWLYDRSPEIRSDRAFLNEMVLQ